MRSRKNGGTLTGHTGVAVGYTRVSTDKQELGPEAQRESILRWCDGRGVSIVEWYEDRNVSGSCPVDDRPAFMDAVEAVRRLKAGKLVVARRDRLARDVVLAAAAEAILRKNGAVLISAAGEGTDGENPDDPSSLLMRQMVDVIAQYERGMIRMRVRAALGVLKAQGKRYGQVPFGMQLGWDRKTLEPNQAEIRIICRVHELRDAGATVAQIVESLKSEGFRSRSETPFRPVQVRRLMGRETGPGV